MTTWSEFAEALFLGVGLAMDALAVSAALGAADRKGFNWKKILLTAVFFGGFQFMMPLFGWAAGSMAGAIVQRFGKWIAGGLLWVIGGKMIVERDNEAAVAFNLWKLTVLAFATSIDALLVGVGFACLARTDILPDVAIIGIVTALISAGGGIVGRMSGKMLGKHCAIAGGVVLILIGVKMVFLG